MGESFSHVRLVELLIACVRERHADAIIWADSSIYEEAERPPVIGGHVPDLFARVDNATRYILGEAKTRKDLENEHTYSQIAAFLSYCEKSGNARFIMAVPFDMQIFTENLLRRVRRERACERACCEVLTCFV